MKKHPNNLVLATCGFQLTPSVSFQAKSYKVSISSGFKKTSLGVCDEENAPSGASLYMPKASMQGMYISDSAFDFVSIGQHRSDTHRFLGGTCDLSAVD